MTQEQLKLFYELLETKNSWGKNELVFKLKESYLKQVKKAFSNGFENLERTIQNIKSTLENYKKAFFNSSMYVKA